MPSEPSQSTRRDFLTGKSAVEAVEDLAESLAPREAEDGGTVVQRQGRSYLIQVGRRAMACQFEVFLNATQQPAATEQAIAALDLVDELEEQLSVYRHHSEVSRLNAVAAHRPVRVESGLFELLQLAGRLHEQTSGALDITSGPLIQIWRRARNAGCLPSESAIREALKYVGSDKLLLDAAGQTVQFLEAGVTIDLGAIGKGYALDRCAAQLERAGIDSYMIHGGTSSILARGDRQSGNERAGWTVGVQHPLRPGRRLLELQLGDRALGTSGAGTHQFYVQGKRYGHIIDPRTGQPVDGVLSTTVAAPSAAVADALSTAFYVLGPESVAQYCQHHPEVTAWITSPGQRVGEVELRVFNGERLAWRRVGGELA
jgi:thiamine biosynthesis lipoprotein